LSRHADFRCEVGSRVKSWPQRPTKQIDASGRDNTARRANHFHFDRAQPVQPLTQKYSAGPVGQIIDLTRRVSPDERGVAQRHQRAGRMRWTRKLRLTSVAFRGRRSRVVPAPRCWRQVPRATSRSDGGNKAGHRGERGISRKPSRRECRIASAEPVCSCAPSLCTMHTRPRVQRAPGIPCTLRLRG
jgi:hypothetical protein